MPCAQLGEQRLGVLDAVEQIEHDDHVASRERRVRLHALVAAAIWQMAAQRGATREIDHPRAGRHELRGQGEPRLV